ncbi:metal-dependent hydrolase [Salibacterium salarium]|uniref:Metal-dependent hydrolase n=1 Tax=Salibacterium salarium TaxID=284579 RepID=A0A3R9Q490_9BACI|nr:metal-dependent hydrolase [Salibacterium salarium]RSL33303.1 metal-dependent hydrolase [Salibacterium salarium]
MNAGTHVIGAIAAGSGAYALYAMPFSLISLEGALYSGSVIIGGLLPDICQPNSWMGRRIAPLSKIISKVFGHRTITHSILFVLFLYLISGSIQGVWGTAIQFGITTGAGSHLILDMLTPRGISLLYPANYKIKFPVTTKTGSVAGEGMLSIIMLSWVVYFSVHFL